MSPFFTTYGYNIDLIKVAEPLRDFGLTPIERGETFVSRLQEASDLAQAAIASAQERQEQYANASRQPAEQFHTGDRVWLSLRNITTDRPSKKLDWINVKYTIIEVISSHNYRLNTLPGIHNVFHTTHLRRASDDPLPSQTFDNPQPAPTLNRTSGEEWEVEDVLKRRKRGRGIQVLVKWKGYVKPTWEPLTELKDTVAYGRFEDLYGLEAPITKKTRGVL